MDGDAIGAPLASPSAERNVMNKCAHCGSPDVQTGVDRFHCLNCGENTFYKDNEPVPVDDRTTPRPLNPEAEVLDTKGAEFGNPAGRARTPDGVADPGTNVDGPVPKSQAEAVATGEQRDDDKMKGVPEPAPADHDDRPFDGQTEHSSANATLVRSDVHVDDPRGHDMQTVGGFGAPEPTKSKASKKK